MIRHAPSIGIGIGLSLRSTAFGSPAPFSPEALNYFSRLDAAGDTTYVDYKQPLANYIDSLVTLGGAYWDTMESSTSFVGVGIQGVTVPLRDGMTVPTQNNFVAGDLDQLTGLKGNASTKYLSTGVNATDLSQNDTSISVYVTAAPTGTTLLAGAFAGGVEYLTLRSTPTLSNASIFTGPFTSFGTPLGVGLLGASRSDSANQDRRSNQINYPEARASITPQSATLTIFATSGVAPTDARLATYHAGPALDLATLEGLQATLLSEIRTAHTFVAAASYFSRLAAAGDTAHVAYKQPLTNYITSLVELGGAYWDDMKSAASFVGVGIQGVTVPLKAGMPTLTNNNFVDADLSIAGLKGDASTKWLNTGLSSTVMSLNDTSISVYTTVDSTDINYWLLGNNLFTALRSKGTTFVNGPTAGSTTAVSPTLYGGKRSTSTHVDVRVNGTTSNFANTSSSIGTENYNLFTYAPGSGSSDARLATYHIGAALNLATLETLQDTLISEIAAI